MMPTLRSCHKAEREPHGTEANSRSEENSKSDPHINGSIADGRRRTMGCPAHQGDGANKCNGTSYAPDHACEKWDKPSVHGRVALPNGSRLSCGALKKDSFSNLRAPPASSAC